MVRDFSQTALDNLLATIDQINDEQICGVTDFLGDLWYGFLDLIGQLDAEDNVDQISSYHKKVLDKNNTSKEELRKIFDDVHTVDTSFAVRFTSCQARLDNFKALLTSLASMFGPGGSGMSAAQIQKKLFDELDSFKQDDEILDILSKEGLTEENLENIDNDRLRRILERLAKSFLAVAPNVNVGGTFEMPIGPGLIFYYRVDATLDTGNDYDLNLAIENQRLSFEDMSATAQLGSGSIEINTDGSFGSAIEQELPDGSILRFKVGTDLLDIYAEESIETHFPGGSVTSTIGIRKTNDQQPWWPVPVVEKVPEPVPVTVPDFTPDWHFELPSLPAPSFEQTSQELAFAETVLFVIIICGVAVLCFA